MNKKKISIVISAYNEEGNINKLYEELLKVLVEPFEIIFVNDGSTDKTLKIALDIHKKDKRVKIVNLKRNFGHEIAMTAGMDFASGDVIIFMDADLQHPPSYIPEMIKRWENGANIVLTKRIDNLSTSFMYKICGKIFYTVLNFLYDTKIPEAAPDFRLLDKKYIDFLKNFNEHDRLFRGLLAWIEPLDKVEYLDFVAPNRFSGTTKYNFSKNLKLAIDAILQFSTKPLRIATYLGVFVAFLSGMLAIYVIVEKYIILKPVPGYATIVAAVGLIGATQLIVLGIIGEYIGKIHMEVKKRPLYFADFIGKKDD